MKYLLCIIPPLGVLAAGKPGQALLNCILTLLFYFPGLIHALLVVASSNADDRTDRVVKQMEKQRMEQQRMEQMRVTRDRNR